MPFPVDNDFIDRAAAKLGIRFPPSFVAHLHRSNGGEIDVADDTWQIFPVFDDSDPRRLKRTSNDIVRETKLAREWPGFPSNGVAIASNGTGDKLVFLPSEPEDRLAGRVYWWDHETGELTAVADDFSDFVDD